MGTTQLVLMGLFLGAGCFFALTGAVGLLRMPDFYSRLHAAGKADTLAQTFILVGLLILTFSTGNHSIMVSLKLFLITVFIYVTAPTATHAITKAAFLDGARPWQGGR
jgi:multicomponent Na+:H+ antiporter subunit G